MGYSQGHARPRAAQAACAAPIPGDDDLETALALTSLVLGQFKGFGTDGSQTISNDESRGVLSTLTAVLARHDVTFSPPWRDFDTFKTYWLAHDGHGSWAARRQMLADVFDPVFQVLQAEERRHLGNYTAEPVSPRPRTGWERVDQEIDELRRQFRRASTQQDYRDVGNRAVGVLEALSDGVYEPIKHDLPGKGTPPVDKTDIRIRAFIDEKLPGSGNEELRGLVKKASALAHKMKHSPRADRTRSGMAADAVIMLANLLRRLAED